jgi:hypothetical protein
MCRAISTMSMSRTTNNAPIAGEARERIGQLFDVERMVMGLPPEQRRRIRQSTARPLINDLAAFLDASLAVISGRSELGQSNPLFPASTPAMLAPTGCPACAARPRETPSRGRSRDRRTQSVVEVDASPSEGRGSLFPNRA